MRSMFLLSGRKRTGKGTAFEVIKNICNNTGEFFFAKPMKDFCINTLGLTHAQMYGTNEERESPTHYSWGDVNPNIRNKYKKRVDEMLSSREVLQIFGIDVMRNNFSQKVWAEAGIRAAINSSFQCCVLTDARMKNELTAAFTITEKAQDFLKPVVIRLYRETGLVDGHLSETDLDCYDAIPNQRNINQGIPVGYTQLASRLFVRAEGQNPFDYLLDNNGTVEEFKFNTALLVGHWLKTIL
jgi:hypothetical protein